MSQTAKYSPTGHAPLPMATLKKLLSDLHKPNPIVFWCDLSLTAGLAWIGILVSCRSAVSGGFSILTAISGIVAVLALYRLVLFIHEISHQSPESIPGIEVAWNIVCGIPFLMPSFFYSDHKIHHAAPSFGTARDGEYFEPHRRGWRGLAVVTLAALILPLGHVVRFMVLTPMACVNRRMRAWVDRRVSSLAFMGMVDRDPPKPFELRQRRMYELSCTIFIWVVAAVISIGFVSPKGPLVLYLIVSAMLLLNGARLMVAHPYEGDDHAVSRTEQFLDSFNYSRRRYLSWIWAPLGLHLHALHHLFPGIPYHNLPAAHRRLLSVLPSDSIYHLVEARGFWAELRAFLMPVSGLKAAHGRVRVQPTAR